MGSFRTTSTDIQEGKSEILQDHIHVAIWNPSQEDYQATPDKLGVWPGKSSLARSLAHFIKQGFPSRSSNTGTRNINSHP